MARRFMMEAVKLFILVAFMLFYQGNISASRGNVPQDESSFGELERRVGRLRSLVQVPRVLSGEEEENEKNPPPERPRERPGRRVKMPKGH